MREISAQLVARVLAEVEVTTIVCVAFSGIDSIIHEHCRQHQCIFASREEEAIAIAAGLSIGGKRAIVLMQQSGVGNSLNVWATLVNAYGLSVSSFVFDRGESDANPVQRISSTEMKKALSGIGYTEINVLGRAALFEMREALKRGESWILLVETEDNVVNPN
jgi:sulfopyruvate decarboxylase TPP-binding subunit